MKVDGGCHCGAFEAEADPARVVICHCADCQTLTGSAFRYGVVASPQSFRPLRGPLQIYEKTSQRGTKRQHHFCPVCATCIYTGGAEAASILLSVGTLRQRAGLRPSHQVWTRSSCAWVEDIGTIPGVETQPLPG